MAHLVSGANQL